MKVGKGWPRKRKSVADHFCRLGCSAPHEVDFLDNSLEAGDNDRENGQFWYSMPSSCPADA